ncbi:hypothetical protein B0F90DRAFT_601993 [Multifurca ochricompacta]|uniref:Crinkler effector protein N-terminal domain-containing protein n=1 Tax=Multifurca ochricompacta TaxID=376703 RepID=A0AAD4QMY4_9AGAM|nr:hypothetical protein B0F90DRAFT_601993 [Multifurca ochricompacta]
MAPMLTLFCLVIDNQKVPIGNILMLQIQSDSNTPNLRKLIKAEMANQLSHLAANQLIVWKLLKPRHIRSMEDEGSFYATVQGIELPDPKSDQALHGNAIERPGSINIDRVRETADHLYSTLWKKPLNSILANIDVPDPKKSYFMYPKTNCPTWE